jgi:hypothetical protein
MEADMSELSELLTFERFEKAFNSFVNQAEKNAISGLSEGSTALAGVPKLNKDGKVDGAHIGQKFGQGGATSAPHLNWHVVSIYYVVKKGRIVIGIQKARYKHVSQMKPISFEELPISKDKDIAVFYEVDKSHLNTKDLYDNFMKTCEQVRILGLELNEGYHI